jgi:hypothetical protein
MSVQPAIEPMPLATFIRDYANVLDQVEAANAEVVLERRAGRASFVVAPLRRVQSDRHAMEAVTRVLRYALDDAALEKRLAKGILETFPWVTFLPATERTQFEAAVLETLRGCAALGRFTAFEDLVDAWRGTAELWSDPASARRLLAPIVAPHGGAVAKVKRSSTNR